MSFVVWITDEAHEDSEAIFAWIEREGAGIDAMRWYEGVLADMASLAVYPERCPLAPEALAFELEIRQLVAGNYRILFVVERSVVRVLHVRHGARRPLEPDSR